jgi:hypothetical protein
MLTTLAQLSYRCQKRFLISGTLRYFAKPSIASASVRCQPRLPNFLVVAKNDFLSPERYAIF